MKLPDNENLTAVKEKILPVFGKYRAVLAILLAGVLLLASGHSGKEERVQTANTDAAISQDFDLNDFQQELQARLTAISGAGRVELMLSLDQTEESVYAVNTRQTSGSDSSSLESDVSVVSNGSYGETPVTVKSVLPVFRGAVVLCDGADDASVRLFVTQAVSTVCGIGADKVTVLKMKSNT
ncbi:MAG: hypothetical protein UEF48_09065 [Agathobaculum butyriciproducens]|nr:hypothetical protein [Agathobaculum butyriciproducens]